MKQPSHTKLHLVPPRMATLIAAAAMSLAVPASADITVTFTNSGTSVNASYSGSLNTSIFGPPSQIGALQPTPYIFPSVGMFGKGGSVTRWNNVTITRSSGGAGGPNGYGTGTGGGGAPLVNGGGLPFLFIQSSNRLEMPSPYVSGTVFSGNVVYQNMTVATLGIVNTEYTLAGGQKIIIVNGAAVPEIAVYNGPGTTSPELTDGQATAVNFGSVQLGQAVTRDFTLRNSGTAALLITNITFSGASPGCYTVQGTPPSSIAAGGVPCTV